MNQLMKSPKLLLTLWSCLVGIGLVFAFPWYFHLRDLAQRSKDELAECVDLSKQIESLIKSVPDNTTDSEQQEMAFGQSSCTGHPAK